MTDGRTYWWAKDAGWWRRGGVVELCGEFGGIAAAVVDWLTCEAKSQDAAGVVRASFSSVAHGAFTDIDTVRHVVSRAATLGVLDDLEVRDRHFDCRISGWHDEQEKALGQMRSARYRERKRVESPGSATDPETSRDVTDRDASRDERFVTPTGQDRTEKETRATSKRVDPDAVPHDMPPVLVDRVEPVLAILTRLQAARGGKVPTRRGVALAMRQQERRDHIAVTQDLERWAIDGNGSGRTITDWTRTLANFLERATPADPSNVRHLPVRTAQSDEERRRAFEGGASDEEIAARLGLNLDDIPGL